MQIRLGYELVYQCPQPTPMILHLHIHYTRTSDLVRPDYLHTDPPVPISMYRDGFGNWCSRIVAPPGRIRLTADALINDRGDPEPIVYNALQHPVETLPEETLVYLLGSRYCETDLLTNAAWQLFGHTPLGWARVQAICDYVHQSSSKYYVWLSIRPPDKNRLGNLQRAPGRMPRLRPSRDRFLPLPEHPCPLLHRLFRRYRSSRR